MMKIQTHNKPFANRIIILLFALAALSLTNVAALAETANQAASQNPSQINSFEVEGGYKIDFNSSNNDEGFYKISYKGSLVKNEGTPFKYAKGVDLTTSASETGSGDRNKFAIHYEHGSTTLSGGFFDANGILPIKLGGLENLDLRGAAFIGADEKFKILQIDVGLETPPVRLPGFKNTQFTNWLVLGATAHRQEDTNSSNKDNTNGLITYRAFLGKAFGWRKSADLGKTAGKIADDILKQYPSYNDAIKAKDEIEKIPANKRTPLQRLVRDTVVDTDSKTDEQWKKNVAGAAFGRADAITDQPTVSFYAEDSGWYSYTGKLGEKKLSNLLAISIDYWILPDNDNLFIRVRYENGYEMATPTDKKNQLLVSATLKF
jgi:hypothetical protein